MNEKKGGGNRPQNGKKGNAPSSGQSRQGGSQPRGGYQKHEGSQPREGYQKREGGYPQREGYQKRDGGYQPREGYQKREGGYQPREGYQKREGGYQQRDGYQKREGGYPQRDGYQKREGGYQQRDGYQKREGGYPQRDGYQKREGGYQPREGYQKREGSQQRDGYQKREGGYPQRDGYQKREGGYQQRDGYQKREGGYQPREGYQKREGGYQQRDGYQKREGGYPQRDGYQKREGGYQQRAGYQPREGYQKHEGGYPQRDGYQKREGYQKNDDAAVRDQSVMPAPPAIEAQSESEQTLPYFLMGRNTVREALKSGRSIDRILVTPEQDGSLREILALAKHRGIVIRDTSKAKLDELCMPFGHNGRPGNHQGILALVPEVEYCQIEDILQLAKDRGEPPFLLLLDEINDPHNLGSILRSASCAGVHGVIIPKRRAASVTSAVARASAGAVEYVKVAKVSNLSAAMQKLKSEGIWIAGGDTGGAPMGDVNLCGPLAFVVGNEGEGLSRLVKENCDHLVRIPLRGPIDSLNVSVAAAILLFEKVRQDAGL